MENKSNDSLFIVLKIIGTILIIVAVILILLPIFFFAFVVMLNQSPTIFVYSSAILLFITLIMFSVKKTTKMAFSNPFDVNYKRKTNTELYSFVVWSCFTAFIFAVISFAAFMFIAILYWFYFIIFMFMFSKVWKFHGKKRWHLFIILIITLILSFIGAPFIRNVIVNLLHYYNIY